MIIGTVRPEEAKVFDSQSGYHRFHTEETQEPYGSLEVFWSDDRQMVVTDDEGERRGPGWYWWACFPGCIPDGEPSGPFATSRQARKDADEWAPEFDQEE